MSARRAASSRRVRSALSQLPRASEESANDGGGRGDLGKRRENERVEEIKRECAAYVHANERDRRSREGEREKWKYGRYRGRGRHSSVLIIIASGRAEGFFEAKDV